MLLLVSLFFMLVLYILIKMDYENTQSLFVSPSSAGALLLHLLDWVRLHKADVDEKAREVLHSESPAEHHDYWDVVRAAPGQI